MLILDSHSDTPSMIYRLRDIRKEVPFAQVDFPKLERGGVNASFFALYIPSRCSADEATAYALKLASRVYDAVGSAGEGFRMGYCADDAADAAASGKCAIFMGMENGSPLQQDLSLLRMFHRIGVRYVTLTHSQDNQICDSCTGKGTWGGLSPFGREVVTEMNSLGMIVDVAHCSDNTFYDCIRQSRTPIVSTHSCCRAMASHPRNMTDDMIRTLADHGGVIQINFYPVFLSDKFAKVLKDSHLEDKEYIEDAFIANPGNPEKIAAWNEVLKELAALPRPSYTEVVDHIDHAVKVGGIDHVGIGSDFDGINVTPDGLEDVSKIGLIFEEMRRRGYSESDIEKVAGGNFLRVMREVENFAGQV